MTHDVFISYSSKDKPVADTICAGLEARGIPCWIAPRDILPGAEWPTSIVNAISSCKVFVLVFAASSNESSQVKKEVDYAVKHEKRILPFRIEKVEPTGSLEYYLGDLHWLDALTQPIEKNIEKLSDNIHEILGIPSSKLEDISRLEEEKKEQEISSYISNATTAIDRELWNQVEQITTKLEQLGDEGRAAALDLRIKLVQAQRESVDRARRKEEDQARIEAVRRRKEISRLLDDAKAGLDRESWSLVEKIINSLSLMGEAGEAAADDVRKRLKKAQAETEERTQRVAEEKVRQEKERNAREISRLLNTAKVALERHAWNKVEGICIQLAKFGEEGQAEAKKLQELVDQALQERQESHKGKEGKPAGIPSGKRIPDLITNLAHSRYRWIAISVLVVVLISSLIIWLGSHTLSQQAATMVFQPPVLSKTLTPSTTPDLSEMLTPSKAPNESVTPALSTAPTLLATTEPIFGAGLKTLYGHTDNVYALAFSTDGLILASGANDKTIRLWRVSDGNQLKVLEGHTGKISSLAFSHDSHILVSGAGDGTVRLWQVPDGILLRTLEASSRSIQSVAIATDGKILASGSSDGAIKIWRTSDGSLLQTIAASIGSVNTVVFSPDEQFLASGSNDNIVRIWRLSDGKLIKSLNGHTGGINNIAYSPDGKYIASASSDGTVRLWIVADGSLVKVLEGHTGSVLNIAFLEGEQTLVSGSEDGTILFWQVPDGTQSFSLAGLFKNVTCVAFSPNAVSLALGYMDKTIRLWSLISVLPSSPTPVMTSTGTVLGNP